ncbi:MAG: ribonuclease R, partial [Pirellulaceae bacterium]
TVGLAAHKKGRKKPEKAITRVGDEQGNNYMVDEPHNDAALEEEILRHVNSQTYQPVKSRVIAKKLGLESAEQRKQLRLTLRRLSRAGKLEFAPNHIVRSAGSKTEDRSIVGKFSRTSRGFGFVKPSEGEPMAGQPDIFIAQEDSKDATNGDSVRVRLNNRRKSTQKGPRGRIIEIVERSKHRFVGTLLDQLRFPSVRLDDKQFTHPVSVEDSGAKSAQPGDKVVIEFVRFPTTYDDGVAVIVEVLGARGAPGVDTLTIIHEFELPGEFPEQVLDDAREQAEKFEPESLGDRIDLREHTTVTIDPVDARDFDDAISLTELENGHWKLGVHIADVAHFVPIGSPLDQEARDRATSIYLPDRVIPMLPEIISNHLSSLQPQQPRYAKTVWIEFTETGVPVHSEVQRSVILSDHRFCYEDVDELLADAETWRAKIDPPLVDLVLRMHRLAMLLRQRREKNGALELHLPETKIDLDKEGQAVGAHQVEQTESHQVIEEFMLAANEAVALQLADKELYFLRRIHESPTPNRLLELTQFARELGFTCENLANRFETQKVLQESVGHPAERAINLAVLRSMQKAVYSPRQEGHYALNSDNYCHFTSPIRRYPDLVIHRMFDDLLRGKRPRSNFGQLATMGDHCSDRERRAEKAERELVKLKLLGLLAQQIGTVMQAVITGVEDFGLFAQCVDLPIDGFLALDALPRDRYYFDASAHLLWGHGEQNQFRLGDAIAVEVARVDFDRRELTLKLTGVRGTALNFQTAKTDSEERAREQRTRRPSGDAAAGEGGHRKGKPGRSQKNESQKSRTRVSKSSSGKSSTGRPSTGRPSTGRPSTGRPSTGRPSTGRPSTGRPSTGRPSTGRPSTGR